MDCAEESEEVSEVDKTFMKTRFTDILVALLLIAQGGATNAQPSVGDEERLALLLYGIFTGRCRQPCHPSSD